MHVDYVVQLVVNVLVYESLMQSRRAWFVDLPIASSRILLSSHNTGPSLPECPCGLANPIKRDEQGA